MRTLKNLDLGIGQLWPQWKALFSKRFLKDDIIAGLTVTCVAVPLSLAIALASGVTPGVGLATAIVAGIVCALFGGTPLSVSGPAAAMAVLVASIVQTYGMGGLIVVGFGCGILQTLFGVIGWGSVARYVPMPVIGGFTAGIGAVILIGQLPRALGLPPPPESETLSILTHIMDYLHATNLTSLGLSLLTLAIIFLLPKIAPKLPATLVGVVATTAIVVFGGLNVEMIGQIPDSLPLPKLPVLPNDGWGELAIATLTVFGLTSLQTLLSSTAVDKLSRGERHNPDQELIGQGLGNIASSLFGGIPVAGVIARSALNVQTGAKTRRASIVHSVVLIFVVYFASTWIAKIPIAALAGVLFSVSLRMMSLKEFKEVMRVSKSEALVYALTFFTIIGFDLLAGIQVGVIVAIAITAIRAGKTSLEIQHDHDGGLVRIQLTGSLNFMASAKFSTIRDRIEEAKLSECRKFVIDMSEVTNVDSTGAEELISIVRDSVIDGSRVVLQSVRPNCQATLRRADNDRVLGNRMIVTESDMHEALFDTGKALPFMRLLYGVNRFRNKKASIFQPLLDQLADGQKPHTLFLTCADSRINPNLLTSTDLGELFVVRNVGNALPPHSAEAPNSEQGALEFAIMALGIRDIVVCGHTSCGAMKAICDESQLDQTPQLKRYLKSAAFSGVAHAAHGDYDRAAQLNVMHQLKNLMTYPFIRELRDSGELRVHLWIYDLKRADIDVFDIRTGEFNPMDQISKVPPLTTEMPALARVPASVV